MLTVGSLFSGIGGIELGLERTGRFRTIWFSEIEPYACAVLCKNWPGTPNIGDITQVTWSSIERPDVLTGGFPCQDISIAGKQEGIEGERSGLWFEFLNAIRQLRPKAAIIENVGELSNNGLSKVLEGLAKEGYNAGWLNLQASDFGAPHKRERLFIIAHTDKIRRYDGADNKRYYEVLQNPKWDVAKGNKTGFEWERWLIQNSQANDGTISKSDFCGMDDGLSEELDRIKCLGNAVVPHVAELIGHMVDARIRT